jgi:hypothetical protein
MSNYILDKLKEIEKSAYESGDKILSEVLIELIDNYACFAEREYQRGYYDGLAEGSSQAEESYYDTGYEVATKDFEKRLVEVLKKDHVVNDIARSILNNI